MAGHSHAANVKRRKNAVDAKRAKIFSKCARHIMSAARVGGADPDANLSLKYAIEKAKAANMPKDNIERAIKKGAGEKGGDAFEELTYEGYAPGGVALIVVCLTDNRNRTAPDVKHLLEKRGGSMGTPGSVSFSFDRKSVFLVETGGRDEDALTELALEAGADDVEVDGELATFYAGLTDFIAVKAALEEAGLEFVSAEQAYVPQNTVEPADLAEAKKIVGLIDELEDLEDVQNVYANHDLREEWLAELG
jgi:YebC/PmpR family DNA-binding regulatory protein